MFRFLVPKQSSDTAGDSMAEIYKVQIALAFSKRDHAPRKSVFREDFLTTWSISIAAAI